VPSILLLLSSGLIDDTPSANERNFLIIAIALCFMGLDFLVNRRLDFEIEVWIDRLLVRMGGFVSS
jgi:hypothetical protein